MSLSRPIRPTFARAQGAAARKSCEIQRGVAI